MLHSAPLHWYIVISVTREILWKSIVKFGWPTLTLHARSSYVVFSVYETLSVGEQQSLTGTSDPTALEPFSTVKVSAAHTRLSSAAG